MAAGAHAAAGQMLTALSKAQRPQARHRWRTLRPRVKDAVPLAPVVAADLACQTVPRALADTLPGRGPAGLAALIEGPATLILSTMKRGFRCGECRTRG